MAERLALALCFNQNVSCLRRLPALRIEVSERAKNERQKQPDLVLARQNRGVIESFLCVIEIAMTHLHKASAVFCRDDVVRPVVLFGETAGLPRELLGIVVFADRRVDES